MIKYRRIQWASRSALASLLAPRADMRSGLRRPLAISHARRSGQEHLHAVTLPHPRTCPARLECSWRAHCARRRRLQSAGRTRAGLQIINLMASERASGDASSVAGSQVARSSPRAAVQVRGEGETDRNENESDARSHFVGRWPVGRPRLKSRPTLSGKLRARV